MLKLFLALLIFCILTTPKFTALQIEDISDQEKNCRINATLFANKLCGCQCKSPKDLWYVFCNPYRQETRISLYQYKYLCCPHTLRVSKLIIDGRKRKNIR
ncbi:hypothetical protein CAEBREN_07593 [Caenorhabditis brenneri]|uniref:Uncharacterized protein n=1 Tax=Caenorhabditis brenneri TaxID=135651 RepID=G0MJB3_CAEBE|nr:hypothetical protein CAEBREN_07593 [Caenorhabditis brenneri]